MLRAHIGIDHIPLVRSYLDGIPATEAVKFFSGYKKLQKGVMSHIVFPARVESFIAQRERDDAPAAKRKARKQSKAMVVGLVQSLTRLVKKLAVDIKHSDWSEYDKTHSYQHIDFEAKKEFVQKHVSHVNRDQIWDIGCNTGTFSRIASDFCNQVISIDGDHNAVERLYVNEKSRSESNILPIVMDLGNISPNQGWAGAERKAFDQRKKPDLILCLALIHHIRISANIPISFFLEWLYSLRAEVILEFVDRRDEMVLKLMTNKKEQYKDYNLDQFISEVRNLFVIEDRRLLKGGKREVFFLKPK
jgi:SAM-dependent methyltransferase